MAIGESTRRIPLNPNVQQACDNSVLHHWADIGTIASGGAAIFGVLVASIAAGLIVWQVIVGAQSARATTAQDAFREYLSMCMEHPELSTSRLMLQYSGEKSFADLLKVRHSEKVERVLLFAASALNTLEQLSETTTMFGFPDKAWDEVIKIHLNRHGRLLEAVWIDWRQYYGPRFGKLVDTVLAERKQRHDKESEAAKTDHNDSPQQS